MFSCFSKRYKVTSPSAAKKCLTTKEYYKEPYPTPYYRKYHLTLFSIPTYHSPPSTATKVRATTDDQGHGTGKHNRKKRKEKSEFETPPLSTTPSMAFQMEALEAFPYPYPPCPGVVAVHNPLPCLA